MALLIELDRGWRQWRLSDIYQGPNVVPSGEIVANVDDGVIDWDVGQYRVLSVDANHVPTLELMTSYATINNGVGDVSPMIAYYDNHTSPFTLSIDDRFIVHGTDAVHLKVFKGTDVTPETGEVVSLRHNADGTVAGENIELERIDVNNPAIRRPRVIDTLVQLPAGELVTVVVYTHAGGPIRTESFRVTHSTAIRRSETSELLLYAITIVTDTIDLVNAKLLNVPLNSNAQQSDYRATLRYTNGTSVEVPVDGVKTRLHGLPEFNSSVTGVVGELLLSYYPDNNEGVINARSPYLHSISNRYQITTISQDYDNTFRIYITPRWNSVSGKYDNSYYLTNIDYNLLIEIDPVLLVIDNGENGVINYAPGGGTQSLNITLNISDVIPIGYTGLTLTQVTNIVYDAPTADSPWIIDYFGNDIDAFGANVKFQYADTSQYPLDITAGVDVLADWLQLLYWSLHPLRDLAVNTHAPEPSHFRLRYNAIVTRDIPCAHFALLVGNLHNVPWVEHYTVEVVWLLAELNSVERRILGITPVMLKPGLS